ncbi:MAG: TetR/AcrR family transcriptional regulator [Methylophilaceae bacterium]
MTKPASKNPVKTRTKILDASAALFSKHGYNGTSLRDIAKVLNMKAGSLYYHFDSKEQIVLEVLKIGIKNIIHTVIAEVEALPEKSTSREVMVAAAKGHLKALHEKGDYTLTSILNYGQLPDQVQAAGRITREQYEDMWRNWLTNAQDKGDIRADVNLTILRVSILGALNRSLTWYKKGELSIEDIAIIQIGMFWDGIDT